MASLNSRFGFDQPSSSSEGSNPFSRAIPPQQLSFSTNGEAKKTVSFGPLMENSSYSSNDDEESSDNEQDNQESSGGQVDFNKLLVSEQERNQYIDQQFDEAIKEYRKVVQRLEACRVLPF